MIVLDTNVVSEPLRLAGDQAVAAWLDRQAAETLYLTSVSLAELLAGIETMPAGRRRDSVGEGLSALLSELFADRILPFDAVAARCYAEMMGRTRRAGMAVGFADGQIAATALAHGFLVATRDAAPFAAAGVRVIDPWGARGP